MRVTGNKIIFGPWNTTYTPTQFCSGLGGEVQMALACI